MSTYESRSIDEVIFDISFNFGHSMRSLSSDQNSNLMDMLNGSRGLKDRIVAWAHEFDDAWFQRPEDERGDDYIGEIDEFSDKKWRNLLAELSRFDPATGANKKLRAIAVQVIPTAQHQGYAVDPQFAGPDEHTTHWSIYRRLEDGTADHVADVSGASKYDTAMLMGRCLAIDLGVQIEPQPWTEIEHDFTVVWTIDVGAQDAREAARIARDIMQDRDCTATIFEVTKRGSQVPPQKIDLSVPA